MDVVTVAQGVNSVLKPLQLGTVCSEVVSMSVSTLYKVTGNNRTSAQARSMIFGLDKIILSASNYCLLVGFTIFGISGRLPNAPKSAKV